MGWGLSEQRDKQPHRWLFLSALALVTVLLVGMASHEIPDLDRLLDAVPAVAHRPPLKKSGPIPLRWPIALYTTERLAKHPMQVAVRGAARRHEPEGVRHDLEVRRGDNLSHIFERVGLDKDQLHRVMSLGPGAACLERLRQGQALRILVRGGDLAELWYEHDAARSVHIVRDAHGRLRAKEIVRDPELRVSMTTGVIRNSLFGAARAAGLSDDLITRFIRIFRGDIDFVLGLRKGDRFAVIYEESVRDGKRIKQGEILAAELRNRGRSYRAIRFVDAQGRARYYSQTGDALDTAFIRTPVRFSHISSHFSPQRRHPILHTLRAHKGVDYAAPHGTPVEATGHGKVQFAGAQNGYGKTIILEHGPRYTTLYAHLCRLAPGIKAGKPVRQGQIIGYVGSTGFATGPHLHYEFRVDGAHHNPLTMGLPRALPLANNDQRRFKIRARPLIARLDSLMSPETLPSDRKPSRAKTIATLARRGP